MSKSPKPQQQTQRTSPRVVPQQPVVQPKVPLPVNSNVPNYMRPHQAMIQHQMVHNEQQHASKLSALSPLSNNGRRITEDNDIQYSPKKKLWPERSVHIVSHYPVYPNGPPDQNADQYTYQILSENKLNEVAIQAPHLLSNVQQHQYLLQGFPQNAMQNNHQIASRRSSSVLKDVSLKPNQIGNLFEMQKKTVDYHKPAGTLSSLAREAFNITITPYPVPQKNNVGPPTMNLMNSKGGNDYDPSAPYYKAPLPQQGFIHEVNPLLRGALNSLNMNTSRGPSPQPNQQVSPSQSQQFPPINASQAQNNNQNQARPQYMNSYQQNQQNEINDFKPDSDWEQASTVKYNQQQANEQAHYQYQPEEQRELYQDNILNQNQQQTEQQPTNGYNKKPSYHQPLPQPISRQEQVQNVTDQYRTHQLPQQHQQQQQQQYQEQTFSDYGFNNNPQSMRGSPSQNNLLQQNNSLLISNNEQIYLNKIRQASIRQERIFQDHLQKYTLPQSLQKIMDEAKQKTKIDQVFQHGLTNQQSEDQRRKQKMNEYYEELKVQRGLHPEKVREMAEREYAKNHLRNLSQANAEQDIMLKRIKQEQQESYKQILQQQKEMGLRFKEAGGDVNGEFGFRVKRDPYSSRGGPIQ